MRTKHPSALIQVRIKGEACLYSVRVGYKKCVPRITDGHHEVCRVMTNGDREGQIFYPTHTLLMDSFSCSPLNTLYLVLY